MIILYYNFKDISAYTMIIPDDFHHQVKQKNWVLHTFFSNAFEMI